MQSSFRKRSPRRTIRRRVPSRTFLTDEFVHVEVEKTNARARRIPGPKPTRDIQRASYFLLVHITAIKQTIYVPVSVASGRVSTGFVYQIEGTAAAKATASITCRGEDVAMVSLGSVLYSKIPLGKTASYRILVEIANPGKESYKIVVGRINYKLNTSDARYKRLITEIGTDLVKS